MWVRVTAPLALLVMAAGCSGAPDEVGFAQRLADAQALTDRVTGAEPTPASEIPLSGTATYEGYTAVNLDGAVDGSLIGDTTLVADFGTGELSGRAENFFGTVAGGATQDYDGSLAISDGALGVAGRNSAVAEASGQLSGDGRVIRIEADLVGGFTGAGASGMALAGPAGTATVDGVRQGAGVVVAAER